MNQNWLSELAPAHAPPPPGWWPPAPGWWVLAALALALAGGALWRWHTPRHRLRRAALRELRRIGSDDADLRHSAGAIENLLRRYAMAVFGRERVARLTGEAWLTFLGTEGGAPLAGESGRHLLSTAFGGEAYDERPSWLAGADAFVRRAGRDARARRKERRSDASAAKSAPQGGQP
jgi:hypothetical protein